MKPVNQETVTKEMFRLMKEHKSMNLSLTPFEWVMLVGLAQVAMRHPQLGVDEKQVGLQAGAKIQAMMAEMSEPIGLMLELGWHKKFDVSAEEKNLIELLTVDAELNNGQSLVTGVITLDGDGDAVLDVVYAPPPDPKSDRWRYEMVMYGIGDELYICHLFWSVPFTLHEVYRICLGLLGNLQPIDPKDATWLKE